jgi:prepilin-type N-terminal cleavage/methylation domain-containing protein
MNRIGHSAQRRRSSIRDGFTIIELAVVLIIAGILAGIAVPNFTKMQRDKAAMNARDAFVWMANRAKATAVQMGTTYKLEIDPASDRAWVVLRRTSGAATAADTIQKVYFQSEFGADVTTPTNSTRTLCYNPRAYAWNCGGNAITATTDITFTTAGRTSQARMKVLGQIERL